jgi:hypothetical protein
MPAPEPSPSPIRAALYAALANDEEIKALATGVYHQLAPETAAYPFVIFNRQSGVSVRRMGGEAYRNQVWQVQGLARGGSAAAAEAIDERCAELLDGAALEIAGFTTLAVTRESGLDYAEEDNGEIIHHVVGLYRLQVQRA